MDDRQGYAFEDLTGDGLPDLFGYVADSAGVSYPIFLVGARGSMTDELATAAPAWRFTTGEDHLPQLLTGTGGPCALQLWAESPAPDGQAEGWRYLRLVPVDGPLARPQVQAPNCGGVQGPGVQPGPAVP